MRRVPREEFNLSKQECRDIKRAIEDLRQIYALFDRCEFPPR
jgi:hypothetical protein